MEVVVRCLVEYSRYFSRDHWYFFAIFSNRTDFFFAYRDNAQLVLLGLFWQSQKDFVVPAVRLEIIHSRFLEVTVEPSGGGYKI